MKFVLKGQSLTPSKPVEVFPENVQVKAEEDGGKVYLTITASNFPRNVLATVESDGSLCLLAVDTWVKKVIPVTAEGLVKVSYAGRELK